MNPAAHTTPLQQVMGKGRIEVIFGPMFSGKTTELIRRITRFQFAKFRCIVIKYAGDVRYSEADVATHDSRTLPAVSAAVLSVTCFIYSFLICLMCSSVFGCFFKMEVHLASPLHACRLLDFAQLCRYLKSSSKLSICGLVGKYSV